MSVQTEDTHVVELCKGIPLLSQCGLVLDKRIRDSKQQKAERIRESLVRFKLTRQQMIVLNGTCSIFGLIYGPTLDPEKKRDFPLTPVQSIKKVATGRTFRVGGPEHNEMVTFEGECTMMLANLVGGGKVYFVLD